MCMHVFGQCSAQDLGSCVVAFSKMPSFKCCEGTANLNAQLRQQLQAIWQMMMQLFQDYMNMARDVQAMIAENSRLNRSLKGKGKGRARVGPYGPGAGPGGGGGGCRRR